MVEVTGLRPAASAKFRRIFSRIDTVSGVEGLEVVYATLQEFTLTCIFIW